MPELRLHRNHRACASTLPEVLLSSNQASRMLILLRREPQGGHLPLWNQEFPKAIRRNALLTLPKDTILDRLCGAVFLDIKGGFDNVQHDAIMTAFATCGLGGRVFRWVFSYLTERTLLVSTQDGNTKCHLVTQGVPQGVALNLTLFDMVLIGLADEFLCCVQYPLYDDDICVWASDTCHF